MSNAWNFHGYIALPLEKYSQKIMNGAFTSADEIDGGQFAETMLKLIKILYNDPIDYAALASMCEALGTRTCLQISKNEAVESFTEFKRLADLKLNKYRKDLPEL